MLFSAILLVVSAKEDFGIPLDHKVILSRSGDYVDDVGQNLMVHPPIELLEVQLFGKGEKLYYLTDEELSLD